MLATPTWVSLLPGPVLELQPLSLASWPAYPRRFAVILPERRSSHSSRSALIFSQESLSEMNKRWRIFLYAVGLLVLILAIGITFTVGWRPFLGARSRPLTSRHFEA